MRKVVRSGSTEFKYERQVQPAPKLGGWVAILTEILERESKRPLRERRSTQRLYEDLRVRGYDGAQTACIGLSKPGGWNAPATLLAHTLCQPCLVVLFFDKCGANRGTAATGSDHAERMPLMWQN